MLQHKIQKVISILNQPQGERNPKDIYQLKEIFVNIKYFDQYYKSEQEMEIYDQLLQYMKHESHSRNSVVFPIDSTAHKFYIILQGQASVHIRSKNFPSQQQQEQSQKAEIISSDNNNQNDNDNNKDENQNKNNEQNKENYIQNIESQQNSNIQCDKDGNELFCVKILEEGDFFGEQAFISNKKRLATIVCESNCHFAVLSKIHFQDILLKAEEKKFMQELSFLTTKYIFKDWNFSILKALYLQCIEKQCHMNQIIFQEGDQCDYIYIIKQGDFVIKKKSYNKEFEDAKSLFYENDLLTNKKLKPNYQKPANLKLQLISAIDIFGEEDYLKNAKRSYTVECLSNNGILMQLRYEDFNGMIYRDQITKKKVDLRVKQKEKRIKERMEKIEKNIKGLENFYYDPTLNLKIQNVDILKQINGQLSIDDLQLLKFFKNPNFYKVSEEEQKRHDKQRQINQQQIYFNQEAKINSIIIKHQKELINQVNSSKIQLSGQGKNTQKQLQQHDTVQCEHENNVRLDEKNYQNCQLSINKLNNTRAASSKFTNFSQSKRYQTQTEVSNRNFSTNSSVQQKNQSQLQGSKTSRHKFQFQRIQSAKIQTSKFKQNHINQNQGQKNLMQIDLTKFQNQDKNIYDSNNLIKKNQTARTLQSDFNDEKSKQIEHLNNSGDQILEFSQNNSQQKGFESKRSHQSQNSNNTLRLNKETQKKIEEMQKQPFYINLSSSNSPKSSQIKQNKTEHVKSVFTFSGVNDFIERQLNKQVQNKISRIKELKQKQQKFFTRPQSTKATYNKKCITNTSQKEQQSIQYQNEVLTLNDQISSTHNTQLYQEMYNQKNSNQYNNDYNIQDNKQSQNKSNEQMGYKYNAKDIILTQYQQNLNKQDEINGNDKKYEIFLKYKKQKKAMSSDLDPLVKSFHQNIRQLYYEKFRNDNSNVDQLKQVIGTDVINSLKYEPAPSVNQRQKNGAPSVNLSEERKIYLRLKNKIELPFKKNSLQEKLQQYDQSEKVNDLDKNEQKFEESIMKYNSYIISQINQNIQQSYQEQNSCYDDKIQKDQSHIQHSDNLSQQILEKKNLKNIKNIPQGRQATKQYQQNQQVDQQCENGRMEENQKPYINNYEEISNSPKIQVDDFNYIQYQQFQSQKKQNLHQEGKKTNFSMAIRPLSSYVYNYNTPNDNQRILESQMEAEDYDKLDKKNIEKNFNTAQYFDQLQNEQSFKKIKTNRDYMTEANAKQKNLKIQIEQMSKVFQTMSQENQQKNIYLSNTCQNSRNQPSFINDVQGKQFQNFIESDRMAPNQSSYKQIDQNCQHLYSIENQILKEKISPYNYDISYCTQIQWQKVTQNEKNTENVIKEQNGPQNLLKEYLSYFQMQSHKIKDRLATGIQMQEGKGRQGRKILENCFSYTEQKSYQNKENQKNQNEIQQSQMPNDNQLNFRYLQKYNQSEQVKQISDKIQIFNQNCEIIQKQFQFGGKQSYICDFLKQIFTDLISLNEKNKQLLQLNVDDKIQCSQIWDKLNISMKDDISAKYQNYIINNLNQLFDLRENEILNKPQLPNQDKCQQRQQKLLTTQKNQSKFYNLNKILISRMIRYLGTENLGKMIIPGQLKKKMQNILYLVKNCSKTNFGNKKNKKQDYYNHAHYNLLFLSLNKNSIQKMLEKDEKNAIYHKKVYKIDLQKVLEVLQKDELENDILQQQNDNDQLQNIQNKNSNQPSYLLNKLGYQDFQSQSQNIINFNFSKPQIESGCYQYFQDKINNIDNNKNSKPNHLQQQLYQLLLAQTPQKDRQILKDNYLNNSNNNYNIQNSQLNYLNKFYDCETQASHDSNNYQQNNSRNNFSSYDSQENQGLLKQVKKEEVNEYKNNENTVPILSQDSNNLNENQINLQNNYINYKKNSQELAQQKQQDDESYQHIIEHIQEINFIKTCFYYAIVKTSQADFLGTDPLQYENNEYEFRAFSALQLMVQGEFVRRF